MKAPYITLGGVSRDLDEERARIKRIRALNRETERFRLEHVSGNSIPGTDSVTRAGTLSLGIERLGIEHYELNQAHYRVRSIDPNT